MFGNALVFHPAAAETDTAGVLFTLQRNRHGQGCATAGRAGEAELARQRLGHHVVRSELNRFRWSPIDVLIELDRGGRAPARVLIAGTGPPFERIAV